MPPNCIFFIEMISIKTWYKIYNIKKIFCLTQGALSGSDPVNPGQSCRLHVPKLLATFDPH